MQSKLSPYQPITAQLAASHLLISLKLAAERNDCCESTLKNNAKARRLCAYQASFGAPVMVLPAEVEEFLTSRPDIASKHHPKSSPAVSAAVLPATISTPQPYCLSPFPNEESSDGSIGDFGIGVTMRALSQSTRSERAQVAKILFEIARAINETVPAESGNQA